MQRGRGMRKDAAAVALATLRRHEVQSTDEDWEEEEEESSLPCLHPLPSHPCLHPLPIAKTLVATGAKRVKACEQGYFDEWPRYYHTLFLPSTPALCNSSSLVAHAVTNMLYSRTLNISSCALRPCVPVGYLAIDWEACD